MTLNNSLKMKKKATFKHEIKWKWGCILATFIILYCGENP